jgi:hypothetical protein
MLLCVARGEGSRGRARIIGMRAFAVAHEIAAIIEGDRIPLRRARAFAAIVRPAIDDCLAMAR